MGFGNQGPEQHQTRERWDADHFLKNGGHLLYRSMNSDVALEWIDLARAILMHMGCPPNLWACVVTRAMESMDQLCWETIHTTFLEGRALAHISWEKFREIFYSQHFSSTVRAKKKMEFMSLRQVEEGTLVAEY